MFQETQLAVICTEQNHVEDGASVSAGGNAVYFTWVMLGAYQNGSGTSTSMNVRGF